MIIQNPISELVEGRTVNRYLRLSSLILVVLALVMFWNAPALATQEPDEAMLRERLVRDYETEILYLTIEAVTVTAQERGGNLMNPAVGQRFTMDVRANEDLFAPAGTLGKARVLEKTTPAGGTMRAYGVASWRLEREEWQLVDVTISNRDELRAFGASEQFLRDLGGAVLIAGSPEIDVYRALLAAEQAAEAEAVIDLIAGDWVSIGSCSWIDFEHRFTFETTDEANSFAGRVTYRSTHPSPPFESGSFRFTSTYNPRNSSLSIRFAEWIEQPTNHWVPTINLTLADNAFVGTSRNILPGRFGQPMRGDCTYRLLRADDLEAERSALMAPVRAMVERIELGVWNVGSLTGPADRDGQNEWPARIRVDSIDEHYLMTTVTLPSREKDRTYISGEMEVPLAIFLTRGAEEVNLQFGELPRINNGPALNPHSGTHPCGLLSLELNTETGLLTGAHKPRRGCYEDLRLPLIP